MTCSMFARSTSCALAASVVMMMAAPSLAQTQSPSQVPPGETLEQRPPTGSFSFPAAQGLTAPDGAEAIRLILRDLRVDDGLTPTNRPNGHPTERNVADRFYLLQDHRVGLDIPIHRA